MISAEMHIEFLPPGVHKGSALAWLCAQQGLPLSSVASFGDNHNDVEMLKVWRVATPSTRVPKRALQRARYTDCFLFSRCCAHRCRLAFTVTH